MELDGDQVLEDTFSLRSSLVERSLPLLRRGEAPTCRTWPTGLALPCGAPSIPTSTTCGSNCSIRTARSLTEWTATWMRKIEVKDSKVFLNDRHLYQRLVLDQGYFPEGILTAPDGRLYADVELAKEMGFNGARKHQKVEDPRWLFWADTLGFLVGRDGERLPVQPRLRAAHDGRVAGGRHARLQPPLHRRLGPDERELGSRSSHQTRRRPSTSSPSTT